MSTTATNEQIRDALAGNEDYAVTIEMSVRLGELELRERGSSSNSMTDLGTTETNILLLAERLINALRLAAGAPLVYLAPTPLATA